MHPVAEYRAEIAALEARLAELEGKIAATVTPRPKEPEPAPWWSAIPKPASYTAEEEAARLKAEAEAQERQAKAEYDKARVGLSPDAIAKGHWIDFAGFERDREGRRVLNRADPHLDRVAQGQAAEHRAWKQANGLAVRGDDDEAGS